MGLTRRLEGRDKRAVKAERAVAFAGNPNVGKTTLFNALTGLERHTGNWSGKTVDSAVGAYTHAGKRYTAIDLPGVYSLDAVSPEEEIARDFIEGGAADCTVIVCDASCMERNLNLVLQVLSLTSRAVVCVNLVDEAKKRGVTVDTKLLSEILGVPVVPTCASRRQGLDRLREAAALVSEQKERAAREESTPGPMWEEAERIAEKVVRRDADTVTARQLKLDRFLTGRFTGLLSLTALMAAVFFLTLVGANYPSAALEKLFGYVLERVTGLASGFMHPRLCGALIEGGLGTMLTVVAVMLPPMAIFFPLFTLLEDLGFLPRVAFDLDRPFAACGSCGKSALTACMGFGCNAAGVVGCRTIDSPRERLTAILTNSLIPCNGRLPTLTAIIAAFVVKSGGIAGGALGALTLTALVALSLLAVLLISKLLSLTLLRGEKSSFALELPPFRKPRIGQILVRSFLDRTLFVLGRAVSAAFPAGVIIWLLGDAGVMPRVTAFLDPVGRLMGVDGTVLTAFALGLPANELVMPLAVSLYSGAKLADCGWTAFTALQVMLLTLFHSPCITTLLTVRRETRSFKWTLAAFLIPSALGVAVCLTLNGIRLLAELVI